MTATSVEPAPRHVGHWLPRDHAILEAWVRTHIREVDAESKPLHPVIREFEELIESDAEIFMLFNQMFEQVPRKPPYNKDPTGKPEIRGYRHMLRLLNGIMTRAPEFNKTGVVGVPINAILDWSMATTSGYAAFLNARVNLQLKKILNEWARFLASEESAYVLNSNPRKGWFGEDARVALPNFDQEFECDPARLHHGFKSWDDFFTRAFRQGARPVAFPGDDSVIVNACESAPYKLAREVRREGTDSWLKARRDTRCGTCWITMRSPTDSWAARFIRRI